MEKLEINNLLQELGKIYDQLNGPQLILGICGGAALILTDMVHRATTDIDLLYPLELPPQFIEAAAIIAANHGLPKKWINQGPIDLYTMGLPDGYESRSTPLKLSQKITAHLAGRRDQIFFKLYAAADRAGYHVDDLRQLSPTDEEILDAAKWSMTHDVSDGFRSILKSMLTQLGYGHVAQKI
jgi:hypothetical protein